MTGFGSAAVPAAGGRVTAEVRSVNSRFLELKIALPREHQSIEAELRETVQASIERGRVDVAIRREGTAPRGVRLEVNVELARAYADAWRRLQRELGLGGEVDVSLLRGVAGDVIRPMEEAVDPERDRAAIKRALALALGAHHKDRQREGGNLAKDMRTRLAELAALRREVARHAGEMRPILAERLTTRVAALLGDAAPDPTRVVQEVAFALDRGDVTEELTRLESHLAALGGLLRERAPVGKRIEFLLQEALREVNTIGSKANHLPITQAVLRAKGELEKLREQVANVE